MILAFKRVQPLPEIGEKISHNAFTADRQMSRLSAPERDNGEGECIEER